MMAITHVPFIVSPVVQSVLHASNLSIDRVDSEETSLSNSLLDNSRQVGVSPVALYFLNFIFHSFFSGENC